MKTISRKNLPVRLPFIQTALAILLMDYYNAAEWVRGVVGCFIVILWIFALCIKSQEEDIDFFEKEKLEEMRRQQS